MAGSSSLSDIMTILVRLNKQMETSNTQLELLKTENNELRYMIEELFIQTLATETSRRVRFITLVNPMKELDDEELDIPVNIISGARNNFVNTGLEDEDNATDLKRWDITKTRCQQAQLETYVDTPAQTNAVVDEWFAQLEEMIRHIPGVPAPVKKSSTNSFVDSPFVDAISIVEMSRKFNLPVMKMYDGTTDPEDHVT